MRRWVLFLALLAVCCQAFCPDQDTANLKPWSQPATWGGSVPATLSDVVIPAGTNVLYDLPSGNFTSITVNGMLVFKDQDATLDVSWIRVAGGFIMGDETCPMQSKIVVTFWGPRTDSEYSPIGTEPSDMATLGAKGLGALNGATIQLHGRTLTHTWSRLASTAEAGVSVIVLQHVTGWKVGDEIAIGSSDFHEDPTNLNVYPMQHEQRTVIAIDGAAVTLNEPLVFTHWSQGYERTPVALLTRNLVFQGDAQSDAIEFGGHILIRKPTAAKIAGVELRRMGQRAIMGRYPLHLHRMFDQVNKGVYVKNCASHHTYQRGYVIHDTNGVLMQNNVAFHNKGHVYFLEDGSELHNILDHNLGIYTQPITDHPEWGIRIVPTDDRPSIFWIVNPMNTWTNNVASGGSFGYWWALPDKPNGVSLDRYKDDIWVWPRFQPLIQFDDNEAHGADENGIHIDDMQDANGETHLKTWCPVQGPYNITYSNGNKDPEEICWNRPPVEATLNGLLAWKNRDTGIWTRASHIVINDCVALDNRIGMLPVPGPSVTKNCLFVGETDNRGVARTPNWMPAYKGFDGLPRSRPITWTNGWPIVGWSGYDAGGPQMVKNVTFMNFVSNDMRPAGGITALMNGPGILWPANQIRQAKFINANKAYFTSVPAWWNPSDNTNRDSSKGVHMMDADGSITGEAGSWLIGASSNSDLVLSSFQVDPDQNCVYSEDKQNGDPLNGINGWFCPPTGDGYVNLFVDNDDTSSASTNFNGVGAKAAVRSTWYKFGSSIGAQNRHDVQGYYNNYPGNVRGRRGYTITFPHPTPAKLTLNLHAAAPGDWIIVTLPYPSSTSFTVTFGWSSMSLSRASSLSDLSINTYFFDGHLLWLKLQKMKTTDDSTSHGFNYYGGYGTYYSIVASCGNACAPSQPVAIPSALPTTDNIKEDVYYAEFDSCQTPRSTAIQSKGKAWFYWNPRERLLSWYIVHNSELAVNASLTTADGSVRVELNSGVSPVRGQASITHDRYGQLFRGQLYVLVNSRAFPEGEMKGRLGCKAGTTCTKPETISNQPPCQLLGSAIDIFTDELHADYTQYSWASPSSGYSAYSVVDTEAVCGDKAIAYYAFGGNIHISRRNSAQNTVVLPANIKYFQFYAKLSNFNRLPDFALAVYFSLQNDDSPDVVVDKQFIANLALDDTWTRVRIPVARLLTSFTGISIHPVDGWALPQAARLFIDQIQFVTGAEDAEPVTSYASASSVGWYQPPVCPAGSDPDAPTEPSVSSVRFRLLLDYAARFPDAEAQAGFRRMVVQDVARVLAIEEAWVSVSSVEVQSAEAVFVTITITVPPEHGAIADRLTTDFRNMARDPTSSVFHGSAIIHLTDTNYSDVSKSDSVTDEAWFLPVVICAGAAVLLLLFFFVYRRYRKNQGTLPSTSI